MSSLPRIDPPIAHVGSSLAADASGPSAGITGVRLGSRQGIQCRESHPAEARRAVRAIAGSAAARAGHQDVDAGNAMAGTVA